MGHVGEREGIVGVGGHAAHVGPVVGGAAVGVGGQRTRGGDVTPCDGGQRVEARGADARDDKPEVVVDADGGQRGHVGIVGAGYVGGVGGEEAAVDERGVVGPYGRGGHGRGDDVVGAVAQRVVVLDALHEACIAEYVAQLYAAVLYGGGHVGDVHLRAYLAAGGDVILHVSARADVHAERFGAYAVGVVLIGRGEPAVGVRPEHQAVALGGIIGEHIGEHLPQCGRIARVEVRGILLQELRLLASAIVAVDARRLVVVHIEHDLVALVERLAAGEDLLHLARGVFVEAERVLSAHIYNDCAPCAGLFVAFPVAVVFGAAREKHGHDHQQESEVCFAVHLRRK